MPMARLTLAVGAYGYSTSTGRAYLFYNDGSYPNDCTPLPMSLLLGETTNNILVSLIGFWRFQCRWQNRSCCWSLWLFHQHRPRLYLLQWMAVSHQLPLVPMSSSPAKLRVIISASFTSGDFNADGKTDLAVGAYGYSTFTGRTYLFYNDGSIPTTAATADVIITGENE
jgi:hypothetical protein